MRRNFLICAIDQQATSSSTTVLRCFWTSSSAVLLPLLHHQVRTMINSKGCIDSVFYSFALKVRILMCYFLSSIYSRLIRLQPQLCSLRRSSRNPCLAVTDCGPALTQSANTRFMSCSSIDMPLSNDLIQCNLRPIPVM